MIGMQRVKFAAECHHKPVVLLGQPSQGCSNERTGCPIRPNATRGKRKGPIGETAKLKDYPIEPFRSEGVIKRQAIIAQEASMSDHWYDTMVDRPEAHEAGYAGGWVASGLMVLATVYIVYYFGF